MKKIIILFALFLSFNGISQNIYFIKSYGNNGYDFGRDIKQDLDTGYIATGSSSSFGNQTADAFLLKVDSLGNFEWSYNYGGSDTDWGESVVVTLDSSYAIGGYTNSFGNGGFDFYLVRADRDGTPLWENTYGGSDWDRAHSMIQLLDSGFVLVGETYSYGNGNSDIYMVRTDKNGDTLWTRTYGGTENDYANAVILDGDSLVVVGGTESFGSGMADGIILKYHIDGTLGWTKVVGMDKDDYFTSITETNSNEFFLGGTKDYDHFLDCDCGQDFWVYHIQNNGNLIVDTSWTGNQYGKDIAHDIVYNDNQNLIFYGGETTSWGNPDITAGVSDAFISKLLPDFYYTGTYVNNFGGPGSDVVQALDYCYDSGIVGIGNMNFHSSGGGNMFIVRMDKNNTGGFIDVGAELVNEIITLSFEEIKNKNNFKIYPTIVENELNIEGLPNMYTIEVYSNTGQLILNTIDMNSQLDLSFLSKGLYFIKINTENGINTHKIIKN